MQDIEQVFKLQHVLEIEMTRPFGQHSHNIRDITEIEDVWDWINGNLLPVMINHKDEVIINTYIYIYCYIEIYILFPLKISFVFI